MPTLDTFINSFAGGARSNRFAVTITWPSVAAAPNVADTIVIHSAAIPGFNTGIVMVPYYGVMIKIPGDRTWDDWTISVLNDTSFSHRNSFEIWSNAILSSQGNIQSAAGWTGFTTTISVQQLDRQDNVIQQYDLLNAWPHTVSQIDLDYQNNDSVETYQVSFAFTSAVNALTTT